ncbi:hypothetical protein HPB49_014177 [Dermacentor silvarum]|uniref:Uncharacterized protein n=1 Tax=Dermacentor silvarum TaxID=543639 RepID=A0ACB8DJR1_DERSI|nr:hypothetical protein HPB49_014177 [Dermacentor silvarum]
MPHAPPDLPQTQPSVERTPTPRRQSCTVESPPLTDSAQALALLAAAERRVRIEKFDTRFATRLLFLETAFAQPQLNSPSFDGTSSWAAFRVQFESVAALNAWTVRDKAQVLMAQLCGAAAGYLQNIPPVTRSNCEALISMVETRFGGHHLHQLYLTQLKHARQGQRDLQRLAA